MYAIQNYTVLSNNAVRPIICEDWLFYHMHFHDRIISLRGRERGWAYETSITMYTDFASFYDFSIEFWNCSDSVVYFVFHFDNIR